MRQAYLRGYLRAEPVERGRCAARAVRDVPSRRAITSLFVGRCAALAPFQVSTAVLAGTGEPDFVMACADARERA